MIYPQIRYCNEFRLGWGSPCLSRLWSWGIGKKRRLTFETGTSEHKAVLQTTAPGCSLTERNSACYALSTLTVIRIRWYSCHRLRNSVGPLSRDDQARYDDSFRCFTSWDCDRTYRRLTLQYSVANSATYLHLRWGLLRHIHVGSGNAISWLDSACNDLTEKDLKDFYFAIFLTLTSLLKV